MRLITKVLIQYGLASYLNIGSLLLELQRTFSSGPVYLWAKTMRSRAKEHKERSRVEEKVLSEKNAFLFYMYECLGCKCVYVPDSCLVPLKARRGHWIRWDLS